MNESQRCLFVAVAVLRVMPVVPMLFAGCVAAQQQAVFAADRSPHTPAVGATPASFEVDQQGAAIYRIPLAVAPGAGGFQPSPTLVYGSHTGNGPLGMGWTIAGLSSIHRCAAIKPLHGYRGRVDMSEEDHLCIDGRFLVPLEEVSSPLQGREFRTRIESFGKVLADDESDSFTVWTKEGQVMSYGDSAAARIVQDGKVFSWLLSRVADRTGNVMQVRYAVFDNERHVERIDYAGGSVLFEYEDRSRSSTAYLAGMALPLTRRLVRIVTLADDSSPAERLVREYRFAYLDPDGVRPDRLRSMTECVEDGACFRPTVFEWQAARPVGLSRWGDIAHTGDTGNEHRRYHSGDFNGDGLTDIYRINGRNGTAYDEIYINRGDGSFENVTGAQTELRKIDDLSNFRFADFNGDGLTDIYQFRYREAHDSLYLARLSQQDIWFEETAGIDSGVAASPTVSKGCVHHNCLRFGDFNGDGGTDIYRIRHAGRTPLEDEVWLSNGDGTYERAAGIASAADTNESRAEVQVGRIKLGDFNGDGISDVYRVRDASQASARTDDVYLTLGPGRYLRWDGVATDLDLSRAHYAQLLRIKFGDFNGDGLTDIHYVKPGTAVADEVYLSHGDGRYTVIGAPNFNEPSGNNDLQVSLSAMRLSDFNGDGRTDIYYMTGGRRPDEIHLSAHHGWQLHQGATIALKGAYYDRLKTLEQVHLGDFNGDGVTDIYHLEDARAGMASIHAAHRRDNLIVRFTDGLGAAREVRYQPLFAVHQLAASSVPTAVRMPPPVRVVSEVRVLAGEQVLRRERYRYGGARSDPAGFGFLGFEWRELRDVDRELLTRSVYSQSFPYFGSLLEETVSLAEGEVLSRSRMEYASLELHGGKSVFPYPLRSETHQYEMDGEFVSRTVNTMSDHDEYGNAQMVETLTEDDSRRFEQIVRHQYFNDDETWLLGRRLSSHTVHRDGVHAEVEQREHFEYDPHTGSLLMRTIQPDEPLAVMRRYEYDDVGNRIATHTQPVSSTYMLSTRTVYDESGRFPLRVVNAEGHAAVRQYDPRFAGVVRQTDANGLLLRRTYDGWGRVVGEIYPGGTQTTIVRTYELPGSAPRASVYAVVRHVSGQPVRRIFHDAFGRVLSRQTQGFDGRVLSEDREYDGYGRVLRISLPYYPHEPVDWVERRYDRLGRLLEEESPLIDRAVTTRWFDYAARTVKHTDELGHARLISRDALGRIVSIVEPLGAQISFEYDPAGRMLKAVDAHNNELSMAYDVFGNRTRMSHPDQGVQRFEYNSFGRVVRTVDAVGAERRMRYDRLGRLIERSGPEGVARWVYDAAEHGIGKLSSESYNGHRRSFRYDTAGRLSAIEDHRGYVTAMSYEQGRLHKIHYPRGFVIERLYNEHGHLRAIRSPFFASGDFDTAAVDGMPAEVLYRGKVDEYQSRALFYRRWAARLGDDALTRVLHDAAGRLEHGAAQLRAPPSPGQASPAYCDRRMGATLVHADTLLQDAAEDAVRLRLNTLKAAAGVAMEWRMYARMALSERMLDEAQNCLADRHSSESGADDEPAYLTYWQVLERDALGRAVSEHAGNGWHTTRRYHTGNGYLQEIRSVADEARDLRHLVYDYDEADNLLSRTDQVRQTTEHFGYDELDRLTAAVTVSDRESEDYNRVDLFRYDEIGNVVFHSGAGDYSYASANAATHVGGDAYEYDASGNLVRAPGFSARWFSFGKPAMLERDGRSIEFTYDANGDRLSKRSSDEDTTLYLGKFYERTVTDNGAVEHRYYIYADNRLVAVRYDRENGDEFSRRLRYVHQDALGSVDTLSDEAGEVVERLSYTAFGERRASDWREGRTLHPPMLVNRGFTGHEHLDEVGLIHMNGRIYDPGIGRFLTPDPYVPSALATQSYNRYSYALNNPMKFTDPSGFFFKKVFKGIKRAIKKAVRFVRRHARVIAAVAAGYYAGVWASNAVVNSAVSKLVWSPGGMWSGTYIGAYQSALSTGAVVGGAVSGGVSSALSGGGVRGVLANAAGGGVLGALGVNSGGKWTPQRVLSSAAVNGVTAAAAGGNFRNAALSGLQWGGLRYAAAAMRRAMVAQSLLNPDNAGGLSGGFFGDRFKLGGGRHNAYSDQPSPLGGHQGGQGRLFGRAYEPNSLWDRVVEAYAGPHDYLNSFYWYDGSGNIKPHLSPAQRHFGEVLNGANVLVATPFAAVSLVPAHISSR